MPFTPKQLKSTLKRLEFEIESGDIAYYAIDINKVLTELLMAFKRKEDTGTVAGNDAICETNKLVDEFIQVLN